MSSLQGGGRRPGKGPILASAALHIGIFGGVWLSEFFQRDEVLFTAIEMTMADLATVAELREPTPPTETPPEPTPRREPEPTPPQREPEPRPTPPAPRPEPTPTPPPEPRPEPTPRPEPEPTPPAPAPEPPRPQPSTPAAEPTPAEMRIRMEGLRTQFPAYYARIVEVIERCFRQLNRNTDPLVAVIRFEIAKDGRVSGRTIRPFQRSGNALFDATAMESIECAGRGDFGPLPPEMPVEVLPVEFRFSPR